MEILVDNFPFNLFDIDEPEDWQVVDLTNYELQAHLIEQRRPGLLAAWVGADARRLEHSIRMKETRKHMPPPCPHKNGMSDAHKAALSLAQRGNRNSAKPHKYPATRKSPTPRDNKQPVL